MSTNQSALDALTDCIGARVPSPGDFLMPIGGLGFYRREQPAAPVVCMVEPSIVLVVQGEKQLWVGGEGYTYDTSRFLLTSLDIPANSEVLVASPEQPCLGLMFKLDLRMLAELIAQGDLPPTRERAMMKGVGIGTVTDGMLTAFARLVALLDEPEAIPVLAPLIQREIHYRLLKSDRLAGCARSVRWTGRATGSPRPSIG
jgi:hypothetical protein